MLMLRSRTAISRLETGTHPGPALGLNIGHARSLRGSARGRLMIKIDMPLGVFSHRRGNVGVTRRGVGLLRHRGRFCLGRGTLRVNAVLARLRNLRLRFGIISRARVPLTARIRDGALRNFLTNGFTLASIRRTALRLRSVHLHGIRLLQSN